MSAVEKLRPGAEPKDAPALGFSLQVDLGAGRVGTFQTFVPNDCAERELNLLLDKMSRAGDRQRAHYRVEELEAQIAATEKERAQHQEDLERITRDHETAQAILSQQLEQAQTALANFETAKRDAHVASGRRGAFELKGADKSKAAAVEGSVESLKTQILKARNDHEVAANNLHIGITSRAKLVAKAQAEIAKCREIVASGLAANG